MTSFYLSDMGASAQLISTLNPGLVHKRFKSTSLVGICRSTQQTSALHEQEQMTELLAIFWHHKMATKTSTCLFGSPPHLDQVWATILQKA